MTHHSQPMDEERSRLRALREPTAVPAMPRLALGDLVKYSGPGEDVLPFDPAECPRIFVFPTNLKEPPPRHPGVLVVGEAPNKVMAGAAWRVLMRKDLAEMAGMDIWEWGTKVARCNLLNEEQARSGHRGFKFDSAKAEVSAYHLSFVLQNFEVVVLLGRRVQRAFRFPGEFYQGRQFEDGTTVFAVPHPSKASGVWNDPAKVQRAREFWTEVGQVARAVLP